MSSFFHVIKIEGGIAFESKHANFRAAVSEYFSHADHGGIQLCFTEMQGAGKRGIPVQSEDVVVEMQILRMKQNPADHSFPPKEMGQESKRLDEKELPVVKATKKSSSTGKPLPHQNKDGIDTCFY